MKIHFTKAISVMRSEANREEKARAIRPARESAVLIRGLRVRWLVRRQNSGFNDRGNSDGAISYPANQHREITETDRLWNPFKRPWKCVIVPQQPCSRMLIPHWPAQQVN
jgi:hypothetical protein